MTGWGWILLITYFSGVVVSWPRILRMSYEVDNDTFFAVATASIGCFVWPLVLIGTRLYYMAESVLEEEEK